MKLKLPALSRLRGDRLLTSQVTGILFSLSGRVLTQQKPCSLTVGSDGSFKGSEKFEANTDRRIPGMVSSAVGRHCSMVSSITRGLCTILWAGISEVGWQRFRSFLYLQDLDQISCFICGEKESFKLMEGVAETAVPHRLSTLGRGSHSLLEGMNTESSEGFGIWTVQLLC